MVILLVNILGYFIGDYWWLLVAILLMTISSYYIGGYFRLNYHRLLMVIGGVILLIVIGEYSTNKCFIGGFWWILG